MKCKNEIWILFLLLCIISVADFCITADIIHHIGPDGEINLTLHWLINATHTVFSILLFKATFLTAIFILIALAKESNYLFIRNCLMLVDVIYIINLFWSLGPLMAVYS